MKNDLMISAECKVQLTMKLSFMSSKDSEEKRLMHPESDNKEMMTDFETEDIIQDFFSFAKVLSKLITINEGIVIRNEKIV